MTTPQKYLLILGVVLGLSASWAAPIVLNNMLVLHADTESAFPAASTCRPGSMMYGTDGGVPYVCPGDGGAWAPIAVIPIAINTVASGSNGISFGTNGVRLDLGTGANDYCSSDGTTISCPAPLLGAGLYSSTGIVESTNSTAPLDLASDMNAATASSTVPAVRACAAANLDANDLIFAVGQSGSCSTERFSVDEEGDVLAVGSIGLGTKMRWSATAPTIASGGCTSPSIVAGDTAGFVAAIGTSCAGVTDIVFTLPASSRVWNCFANSDDAATRIVSQILTGSATSVQLRNFSRTTGLAADWTAGSALQVSCVSSG